MAKQTVAKKSRKKTNAQKPENSTPLEKGFPFTSVLYQFDIEDVATTLSGLRELADIAGSANEKGTLGLPERLPFY